MTDPDPAPWMEAAVKEIIWDSDKLHCISTQEPGYAAIIAKHYAEAQEALEQHHAGDSAVRAAVETELAGAQDQIGHATDLPREQMWRAVRGILKRCLAAPSSSQPIPQEPQQQSAEDREALWREYVEWLNTQNKGPIMMAHVHGWVCPKAVVEQGKEYRKRLGIPAEGEGND